MGLHPDEPISCDVMVFDDKMKHCSSLDKLRKWYCHTQFSSQAAKSRRALIVRVTEKWTICFSMWQLVWKEEAKLFRGMPECFRVIPDFRLGAELVEAERAPDLDFDSIATMITEKHTGVRIEAAKKSMLLLKLWAVYAIDMEKKICMMLDRVEAEEPRHEVEAKHKRDAIKVKSNLRRCIHECIPGVTISSAGWPLDYNTEMRTCCGM